MTLRPALLKTTMVPLLLGCLVAASPAFGQPQTCEFQSHQVVPARPAPGQPFTVTVMVFATCVAFLSPAVDGDRVTVDVECGCQIDPVPPPQLWERSFEVPGLPAGTAVVEFRNHFPPHNLLYRFGLVIGTALDIPAIGGLGALLLAGLLLLSGLTVLGRRRRGPAERLG